jgi:hypothetical protein
MPLAIVLLSGGLDSILAVRVLQQQGVAVEAFNVRTPFDFSERPAAQAASELGVPLTVRRVDEDYVELLRRPYFGYGSAVNPCLDCRIYMARMARQFMIERDACVVATGEVLGQRPMSQKRQDLNLIARRAGLEGRLLRPLSARRLDATIPEQEGRIDRERLFDFAGRGRRELMEMAERLGVLRIPSPSPGCALTESSFAPRVRDLFEFSEKATLWDCELLKIGRQFRIDGSHKVVLGRDAEENAALGRLVQQEGAGEATLIEPVDFIGPSAIVCGPGTREMLETVGALMAGYTRQVDPSREEVLVRARRGASGEATELGIQTSDSAAARRAHVPIM